MATALKIIGVLWAIIGAANIIMAWCKPVLNTTTLSVNLIFNMVLFILPGLVVYGIGSLNSKKRADNPPSRSESELTDAERKFTEQWLKSKGEEIRKARKL